MSDIALRVEGLSKRYRLGLQEAGSGGMYRYKSLRDSLGGIARRPLQTLKSAVIREPMNDDNSFWALKDIDFEVKKGEVVGIIGRNGAGKSTLLKILSRITKPTTGRVNLFGRVGSLLEVGTGFHPELSGRENIYLNGAILGMTNAEVKAKFDEIVAFSEVEKFLDMSVKQYSSGMYMRLAFAVAAHLEPEILVVDEVLAVGDAEFQKKCLGKMREVANEGRTVLFVSHNLTQVEKLCNRGLLLDKGRVDSAGRISEQILKYVTKSNAAASAESNRTLLPGICIQHCEVKPQVLRVNEGCSVSLCIVSDHATSLDDLCVLVCSDLDTHVAAIDLRGKSVPVRLEPGRPFEVQFEIIQLPLVDREYQIGVFARAGGGFANVYGLTSFELLAQERGDQAAAYAASDRGFAELSFATVVGRIVKA